jgi:hypothetical protein
MHRPFAGWLITLRVRWIAKLDNRSHHPGERLNPMTAQTMGISICIPVYRCIWRVSLLL